eukprot:9493334-Pyramimonas_sp.AAC.1
MSVSNHHAAAQWAVRTRFANRICASTICELPLGVLRTDLARSHRPRVAWTATVCAMRSRWKYAHATLKARVGLFIYRHCELQLKSHILPSESKFAFPKANQDSVILDPGFRPIRLAESVM